MCSYICICNVYTYVSSSKEMSRVPGLPSIIGPNFNVISDSKKYKKLVKKTANPSEPVFIVMFVV